MPIGVREGAAGVRLHTLLRVIHIFPNIERTIVFNL